MRVLEPAPLTFGRMIEANERHRPTHPALIHGERSISFADFAAEARRMSAALHQSGVRRQDRVAILSQNSIEQCVITGAGELAGFVTVGLNFRLAGPEIAYQLQDCQAKILFFQEAYADMIGEMRDRLPSVAHFVCMGATPDWATPYEDFIAPGDPAGAPFVAREDDLAYIVYTSGTTGKPKGCMLAHGAQLHTVMACSADLGLNRTDRVLVVMPLFHVGGKAVQLAAHWQGASVILLDRFEPELYLRTLANLRVTVGHLAPPMILALLESPHAGTLDFSELHTVLYSAATMPNALLRRAIEIFGPVFHQQYGLSEGAGTSLHRNEHDPEGDEGVQRRMRSIGLPFPGVELRIADDDGDALPNGTAGEILLRARGRMVGYWNNSAASIETLRDGWLRTGDIGMLDEDGYCYLVDRKKDMIVSGGENIYSREVEEVLFAHPSILEAAVIGVPDEKWGETVRAIVIRRDGHELDEETVVTHCRASLASYKKPRSVVFAKELPRLASGKIDKVEIRKRFGAPS